MTPADCAGRTRLLILQPTPFCNIDCGYCYLPGRSDRHRMPFEIVEASIRFVFQHALAAPDFTVVWHAGEPLVLPVAWYRHAFAATASAAPGSTVLAHSIQTNAMLLTDEWCDFLLEHSVRLGVSIDGPARLHDARRKTRDGKGTHARVMQGIELLQRRGVPFHVIAVIGEQALDAADELVDFFIGHGISDVGFNIEEIEGVNKASTLQADGVRERFDRFFARLVLRARASDPPLRIREQQELLALLRSPQFGQLSHNSLNEPFAFVSVSSRGDVFTFSPELAGLASERYGDMAVGKLPDDSLETILDGATFRKIWSDIAAGTAMCRQSCRYFDLCLGGAPVNKLAEHGDFASTETLYCKLSHQAVADVVLSDLERELNSCEAAVAS